ncbi:MAG: hypothetical protein ACPHCI_08250 [Solirubrobacterales bacterium]
MTKNLTKNLLATLTVMIAAMAVVVGTASSHPGGGARADADGDGASDRCEARVGTSSSDTDSDDNGVVDGLEDSDGDGANNAAESRLRSNCARANSRFKIRRAEVVSYEDGNLTLSIGKKGGLITKAVSSRVVCLMEDPESDDDSASVSRRGGENGERRGRGRGRDGERRGRGRGRGHHDDLVACTTADLVAGTTIRDARVKRGRFVRIRLSDED